MSGEGTIESFTVFYVSAHFQDVFGTKGQIPEIRDRLRPEGQTGGEEPLVKDWPKGTARKRVPRPFPPSLLGEGRLWKVDLLVLGRYQNRLLEIGLIFWDSRLQ